MVVTPEHFVERVQSGVGLESDDAGIRISASLSPAGGTSTKVFPPTYKLDGEKYPYVLENRFRDGGPVSTVLLDATQSQSNRAEEALAEAVAEGTLALPHLNLTGVVEGWDVRVTNLTAPHRGPDAYFRDAQFPDGTPFDKSPVGESLRRADANRATAYFRYVPSDLIFGFWDSWRGGRGVKMPRCYTSEILGWNPDIGMRAAGRVDPNNIETVRLAYLKKRKGTFKLLAPDEKSGTDTKIEKWEVGAPSDIGHGNIPPVASANGGVAISDAERIAFLSFAGLHRLRFPTDEGSMSRPRNVAARTVLACLALVADRLAFARPTLLLRSGCELLVEREQLSWLQRDGTEKVFELNRASALAALAVALGRAATHGLIWEPEPVQLVPQQRLIDLLAATFTRYATDDE